MGGVVGDITGANQAADAAQNAALASQAEARRQFDIQQGMAQRAYAAANSPEELRALKSSLAQQQQSIAGQKKLFEALDPAIMEASQQALKLLRGEEAKALDPLRKQRDRQREKLMNRLRETLGPGAETSTAGIQALTQFDQQTDDLMFGAQQQSMGQLFDMGQSGAVNRGALGQQIGQLANIGSMFGNQAQRRSNALLGGASNIGQAGQGLVNTAGAQFVGQQLRGQAQQQLVGGLLEAGLTAGIKGIMTPSSSSSSSNKTQG